MTSRQKKISSKLFYPATLSALCSPLFGSNSLNLNLRTAGEQKTNRVIFGCITLPTPSHATSILDRLPSGLSRELDLLTASFEIHYQQWQLPLKACLKPPYWIYNAQTKWNHVIIWPRNNNHCLLSQCLKNKKKNLRYILWSKQLYTWFYSEGMICILNIFSCILLQLDDK